MGESSIGQTSSAIQRETWQFETHRHRRFTTPSDVSSALNADAARQAVHDRRQSNVIEMTRATKVGLIGLAPARGRPGAPAAAERSGRLS
jgi:hypothetical protein